MMRQFIKNLSNEDLLHLYLMLTGQKCRKSKKLQEIIEDFKGRRDEFLELVEEQVNAKNLPTSKEGLEKTYYSIFDFLETCRKPLLKELEPVVEKKVELVYLAQNVFGFRPKYVF